MGTRKASFLGLLIGLSTLPLHAQLYAIGSDISPSNILYRVDFYNSVPQRIDLADPLLPLADIAITPAGRAYVIAYPGGPLSDPYELHRIDLASGVTTFIMNIPGNQIALEAADEKTLYSWGFVDEAIYKINLDTMTWEFFVDMDANGGDLALAPNGVDLYGSSGNLLSVNLSSRAITNHGPLILPGDVGFPAIDFGHAGELFGIMGNDGDPTAVLYRINPQDASKSMIRDISGVGVYGMSILQGVVDVPTLSTRVLVIFAALVALGGLILLRRVG
jgi:hypothetical protein